MARRSLSGGMKKKKAEEADLDITPMIDVTFLLLIFFMVASKMDPQKQANVRRRCMVPVSTRTPRRLCR